MSEKSVFRRQSVPSSGGGLRRAMTDRRVNQPNTAATTTPINAGALAAASVAAAAAPSSHQERLPERSERATTPKQIAINTNTSANGDGNHTSQSQKNQQNQYSVSAASSSAASATPTVRTAPSIQSTVKGTAQPPQAVGHSINPELADASMSSPVIMADSLNRLSQTTPTASENSLPLQNGNGSTISILSSGSSPRKSQEDTVRRGKLSQTQYMNQEKAYLHKLRNELMDDYHGRRLNPVGQLDSDASFEEDDEADDNEDDNLGGLSFDDAYTDLSSSYNILAGTSSVILENQGELHERTEWQTMLTSVLTGEVFTSEKSRLNTGSRETFRVDDEARWIELKAKVCGRTVEEQKQILASRRSDAPDVIDKIMNFKLTRTYEKVEEPFRIVEELLLSLSICESMWHTNKAMSNYIPQYASKEFQTKYNAIVAWYTITESMLTELRLLKEWTGNDDADPTVPPASGELDVDRQALVDRIIKQDTSLMSIFKNRIQAYIFPLVNRARRCTIDYYGEFTKMNLPLFHIGLEPVVAFPIKIIRRVIQLQLTYARRLVNPTMVLVDENIKRFQTYMTLGLVLTEECLAVTKPMFDKGWFFPKREVTLLNSTLLECITFYLELLKNKYLDGGKSSLSFFRSFKSIEQLEMHYNFLQATCRLIEGGDISVAERFTTLQSRVLTRLLAYWEHQMHGPQKWNKIELERWFASTIENIRSIQRKLLRFYKLLSDNNENAVEYSLAFVEMKSLIQEIRDAGFFLVFVGSLERAGVYTFASPNLRDQPRTIKNILQGLCRVRDNSDVAENVEPGAVLIFSIEEPLIWDGEIYHLEIPVDHMKAIQSGRLRLVSQGGFHEVSQVRQNYTFLDRLSVVVPRKSHLAKVDMELNKIRSLFYKLATTVIWSSQQFRVRMRPYGCEEIVQSMFAFAREFGQRGLSALGVAKRGRVTMRLIDLCIDWVSFVCDDCPPNDYKTFRWTVMALEFAMVITRGINIIAITDEQFTNLRVKVSDCITLLISHFDIMGARSKAQTESTHKLLPRKRISPVALEDDDQYIAALRENTLDHINKLEAARANRQFAGKVLDNTNTEFEFLTFASSSLSNASMRWQQGKFIGSGAFGSVYQAFNLDSGQIMAVKEVRLHNHQPIKNILKSIKDEMTVLEILSHPNVVQYYGIEVHRERVFLFMEYCEGGSLARLLEYGRIEDEVVTQMYSLQMLEGLAYLHQSGIVHRDIKPENILLDHLGVIKFVDFGAAKVIANTSRTLQSNVLVTTRLGSLTGTPMYMSPEMIIGKDSVKFGSVDIWSIGCCILEMVTGRRPWANLDNEWAIMYHIAASHKPLMPTDDQASPACQQFLFRTMERDPEKRPTAMELLSDPWIVSIRNELLGFNDNTSEA